MEADRESECGQARDVVRWVSIVDAFPDEMTCPLVGMDAKFECVEVDWRPHTHQIDGRTSEGQSRYEGNEGVVDPRARIQPRLPFVRDVQVGDEQSNPEEGAPRHGIPVVQDTEGIIAHALPRCLDFSNDNDSKKGCP